MVKITLTAGELSVSLEAETVEDVIKLYDAYCGEDDWVEWCGGDQPVEDCTKVEIRTRNGDEWEGYANIWQWSHNGSEYDIVAYRVVK